MNSGNGWAASATNVFFVYTPRGVQTCVDSGGPFGTCAYNVYCAYHSNVGTGSNALIYANMAYPLFDGLDVCRRPGPAQQPNGDTADIVLSLTSHEHAEAITDPGALRRLARRRGLRHRRRERRQVLLLLRQAHRLGTARSTTR